MSSNLLSTALTLSESPITRDRGVLLAIGTSAGSVLVTALGVAATVLFGFLAFRHNVRLFAWMQRTRTADDIARELDDLDSYLKEIVERLCEFAQKPCSAEDLAPLRRLRNLINTSAGHLDVMDEELHAVVQHCDTYLAKAIVRPIPRSRAAQLERALESAMQQEHARVQVHAAVTTAQREVRALRKAV